MYIRLSGAKVTNSMRSLIHWGWSAISFSNDSADPSGNLSSILSSAPSSLYIFPPADVWIQTGILCFVGQYSLVISIHINSVSLFVRL